MDGEKGIVTLGGGADARGVVSVGGTITFLREEGLTPSSWKSC